MSIARYIVALVCASSMLALPSSAAAATGPESESFTGAALLSQLEPELDTPGANDPSCRPTPAQPRPVVLVHGTYENRYDNWASLAPRLHRAGYCVFALNFGDEAVSALGSIPALKASGDIRHSAEELATFVDDVRTSTKARQVDLVAHSQGGLVARQYMRFGGGTNPKHPKRNIVRRLITSGATNHGTSLDGIATLGREFQLLGFAEPFLGIAAIQQVRGSSFLQRLNAAGDTERGVDYTVVATRFDEVTTPFRSTFLKAGPGATVRNITLQDGCPIDLSEHVSMPYGPRFATLVMNALTPATARPAPCVPKAPVL